MATPAARLAGRKGKPHRTRSTKAKETTGTSEQIRRAKNGDGQVTPEEARAAEEEFDVGVEKERTKYRKEGAKEQRQATRGQARRTLGQRAVQRVGSYEVSGVSVDDGAGLILGLMVWVVVLNFIRNGPDGVRALLRAKFLNQGPGKEPLP
jgi:hypothetical protein